MSAVLKRLVPDTFIASKPTEESILEFTKLKLITRLSRLGKDLKQIFELWDHDQSGWRK